jgi:hypothetical protein
MAMIHSSRYNHRGQNTEVIKKQFEEAAQFYSIADFRFSRWLIADINSILESLQSADMVNVVAMLYQLNLFKKDAYILLRLLVQYQTKVRVLCVCLCRIKQFGVTT